MSAPLPFTSCFEVVEHSRFDPPADVEPFTGYVVEPYPPADVVAELDASDVERWEDDELARVDAENEARIHDDRMDAVNPWWRL